MPIYEYKCLKCGHQFEVIQRFSDNPVEICPNCKKNKVEKLVSAPSFRLKGGGWYETDFKTGSKKNIVDTKDIQYVVIAKYQCAHFYGTT